MTNEQMKVNYDLMASWQDLEQHLREMLLGGQGDDDGLQIMPDFYEGESTLSMIGSCLSLLETRRDVIEGQQSTITQLRHQLNKVQPANPTATTPQEIIYREACWDTLTYILNQLNTYDLKSIPKKKLYQDILKVRPEDILKSEQKELL